RRTIGAGGCEIVGVYGIAGAAEEGGDVLGVGRNRNRAGEVHLLPSGARLSAEGGLGKQCAGAGIEQAGVRAGIAGAFVEADAGHSAAYIGAELHAQSGRAVVVPWKRRYRGTAPYGISGGG